MVFINLIQYISLAHPPIQYYTHPTGAIGEHFVKALEHGSNVAVIGGGISGMTAALILARHGFNVTLIEKRRRLGPTLRGFFRQGTHFDTGLHYLGGLHPGGNLWRFFHYLGLGDLPLAELDSQCVDRLRFPNEGVEICLPAGYEGILESLCSAFPHDTRFIRNFMRLLRDTSLASDFIHAGREWRAPPDRRLFDKSLDALLREGADNPMLRTALSIHCLLHGVAPKECSFLLHARVAGSYLEGVRTVVGGGPALAAALEKLLHQAGVVSLCGVEVAGLRASGKGISGVLLADERLLPVDGVIYSAHPGYLPDLLPPELISPMSNARMRSLEDTFSTSMLFCAHNAAMPLLRGSNLFISVRKTLDDVFGPNGRPEDGPFYISCNNQESALPSSRYAHSFIAIAPSGARAFEPWKHSRTGKRPTEYTALKKEHDEAMWSAIKRYCPEVASADILDSATPLTNKDYLSSPNCGLYGAKHSITQLSPSPITRIPRLWLAGQAIFAPGILGSILSSIVACGVILGVDELTREISDCV
jgi:all-trans-retinol 13,14-reductase